MINTIKVHDVSVFFIKHTPWWKRVMDIFISAAFLILVSPVFIFVALLVKMSSPGPVFFIQKRAGLNGKPFNMLKFRSMYQDAEQQKAGLLIKNERKGPAFKMKNDPRMTTIGRIIRKFSIDELPQFVNVLKGDMSIVGPRPLPVYEDKDLDLWHRHRLMVRPGITCYWQIYARHLDDFDKWMRLDIKYVREYNLLVDIKLMILTLPAVLMSRGAS